MYDQRGSVWRRWDLHVHGPNTSLHNEFPGTNQDEKWEFYLNKLEAVENVSVLGITDYYSIADYQKVIEFKNKGRLDNFDLILPNVEIRITPVTDQNRAINFHFIFNPAIVDELNTLFFNELKFEYGGRPYICNRDSLIRLGRSYLSDPDLDENTAYQEGANQFKVPYQDLSKLLKSNKYLRDNVICGVSNKSSDGNSGIQHSSLAATREEIYRLADFIFSSNPNDVEYFLGEGTDNEEQVRSQYGSLKPCIHGSDAHKLEDICKPDLDRYTWIKADPTFEGLRQIIFEPKFRVKIHSSKPNEPLIKVNKVSLDLPEDSKLDGQEYCIKGQYDIQFSPFFTCLIGGRGTGKSSILNLIDHLVSEEKNKFFEQHELTDGEDNPVDIEEVVFLDDKSEKGDLEFLSQNEIEDFAQDQHRFTQAIYRRLKKLDPKNEIEKSVKRIEEEIASIDEQIDGFKELKTRRREIKSLKKEIEKNENILASLQDEEYQENSKKLSEKTQRLQRINNSRGKFEEVLKSINQIKETISEDLDDTIAFERALQEISESLEELSNTYDFDELNNEVAEETQELEDDIETITEEINQFLEEKGLSKENLKEASSAKTNLDLLRAEVEVNEEAYQKLKDKLESSSVDQSAKDSFEEVIQRHTTKVNEKFESLDNDDEHVKEIGLEYKFDSKGAREKLGGKVQNWIEESETEVDSSLRIDHLESRLFLTEPTNVDDQESFLQELQSDDTLIAKDLIRHFSDEFNFEIYKLMIAREYLNAEAYKQINVFYDGRPIQNTSFGQRCTAAIIILLSLGNNPIIIDEPEAHLDSALIADNLVDLIKRTKSQRQVIFATHNANFVVNGDAELVHVLSIEEDDDNKMKITPTTIEDLDKRQHLFALEGGEEAFKQRELRYNIS